MTTFQPDPPATTDAVVYGASWSRSTRLFTISFLLSCAAILGLTYSGARQSAVFYITSALIGGGVVVAYWYAPLGYEVSAVAVGVKRRAGRKMLALETLRAARLMEPGELAESIWRFPSVGGVFGFYGTFETPALGRHRWYASRDENLVLLQTMHGPVVVSPDEPAAFVREVNQRLRSRS